MVTCSQIGSLPPKSYSGYQLFYSTNMGVTHDFMCA